MRPRKEALRLIPLDQPECPHDAKGAIQLKIDPQKHLFVGSDFRRFPQCQITDLRATANQGFWAGHEAGQS